MSPRPRGTPVCLDGLDLSAGAEGTPCLVQPLSARLGAWFGCTDEGRAGARLRAQDQV